MKKVFIVIVFAAIVLLSESALAAPFIQFNNGKYFFGFHVSVDQVESNGYTKADEPVKCFLVLEYKKGYSNILNKINVDKFPFKTYTPSVTIDFTDNSSIILELDTCQYYHHSWYDNKSKRRQNEYYSYGYYPLTENIFLGKTIKSIKATPIEGAFYKVGNLDEQKDWKKLSRNLEKATAKAIKDTDKLRKSASK